MDVCDWHPQRDRGVVCLVRLTTIGHYELKEHPDEHFSLVAIQIRTGRRRSRTSSHGACMVHAPMPVG